MNRCGPWPTDSDLAASLLERGPESEQLHPWYAWPDAWAPVPRECHRNAERWAAEHPGWTVHRGWVPEYVMSDGGAVFASHSVVASPEGRLLDVTRRDELRFLRHLGDLATYLLHTDSRRWALVQFSLPIRRTSRES